MFNKNQLTLIFFLFINKLRKFLRDYLDKAKERGHNKRSREYSDQFFNEEASLNSPEWTIKGYDGELKRAVNDACKK